jgi:hypothetical protein
MVPKSGNAITDHEDTNCLVYNTVKNPIIVENNVIFAVYDADKTQTNTLCDGNALVSGN